MVSFKVFASKDWGKPQKLSVTQPRLKPISLTCKSESYHFRISYRCRVTYLWHIDPECLYHSTALTKMQASNERAHTHSTRVNRRDASLTKIVFRPPGIEQVLGESQ